MAMFGSEPALHFPTSAEVPEPKRHLRLRTLLFQFLEYAFADVAAVGSDQFVYWGSDQSTRLLVARCFPALRREK